jgi:hypothetical protein
MDTGAAASIQLECSRQMGLLHFALMHSLSTQILESGLYDIVKISFTPVQSTTSPWQELNLFTPSIHEIYALHWARRYSRYYMNLSKMQRLTISDHITMTILNLKQRLRH